MRAWILLGVLGWACAWPLAHFALVEHFDANPWKLGGFAMYTTPTPPVLVVPFIRVGNDLEPLDERELPATAHAALQRFRVLRHALGRLHAPDALADAIFAARPDAMHLVVAVQRMKLDPRTARMTSVRENYRYQRETEAGPT
ncbi:MAG: hypothetical protein AAF430_26620 [Myxococcota bacterium]